MVNSNEKGLLKIKSEDGLVHNCEITVDGIALDCVTKIVIHPITADSGYITATLTFEKVILDLASIRPEVKILIEDMVDP